MLRMEHKGWVRWGRGGGGQMATMRQQIERYCATYRLAASESLRRPSLELHRAAGAALDGGLELGFAGIPEARAHAEEVLAGRRTLDRRT